MRYGIMKIIIVMLLASVLFSCASCEEGEMESVELDSVLQTEQEEEDATRRDAEVYAEYEGVTVEEAINRFKLMNESGDLQAVIVENEESYAGSWIQHQPEYKFIFAFKGDGQSIIDKYVEKDSPLAWKIKILTFKYSYRELEEIRDSIKFAMESRGVYSYIEIDMKNNSIDCRFYDKESADKVIQQEELEIPDCVNILQYEGLEIPDSLLTEKDRAIDQSNRDELVWSQWWAVTINGTDISTDTIITLFAKYNGTIMGGTGCDQYWSYYNVKGSYIRISGAGKTNVGCADEVRELRGTNFLACLRDAYTFIIERDKLTLFDDSGGVLVVFERKPEYPMNPQDLIGTSWKLYSVDGEPVGDNETGTIVFDEDGVSLRGEDERNTYEYSYEAMGDDLVFLGISSKRKRDDEGNFTFGKSSQVSRLYPGVSYRLIDGMLEFYLVERKTLIFKPYELGE